MTKNFETKPFAINFLIISNTFLSSLYENNNISTFLYHDIFEEIFISIENSAATTNFRKFSVNQLQNLLDSSLFFNKTNIQMNCHWTNKWLMLSM